MPATGGTYQLGAGAPATETRDRADTTALANDRISVTRLDDDWSIVQVGIKSMVQAGIKPTAVLYPLR